MARIRTIKPDFWTDPVMVGLSPLARLLYIGTWNFAMCDQGHLEDDAFRLKLQILPAEDCDAAALIDELVDAGRLVRLEVDGEPYLHVRTLSDHQRVDGRWTPRCPVCTHNASRELTETHASSDETQRASLKLAQTPAVKEGKVKEGKGSDAAAPPRPEVEALCTLLADLIEANGSKRPNITKTWRDEARRLLDIDGYDLELVEGVLRWSQEDKFWQSNVLSMPTLRKQFDRLRLQATGERGKQAQKATGTQGWWNQ